MPPAVLDPLVLLPSSTLSTDRARGLLPSEVPHADAVFNASRAGLLVHALSADPELLMEATEDRLHQDHRAPGMPQSVELMRVLRQEGHAAVISGAGPSVLVPRDGGRRWHRSCAAWSPTPRRGDRAGGAAGESGSALW
ncbi:hypothetical protein [Brachybacterium sacelli]|uniref:hypothetical protein n=1 Tax=Brachybacterium sacelli TaxID=173364 RepID=UPI00361D1BD8